MLHLLQEPEEYDYYGNYLADPTIRLAIHVGNLTYNSGTAVEKHLLNDIMASVKPWIAVLLDNYKVEKRHTFLFSLVHVTVLPGSKSVAGTQRWRLLSKRDDGGYGVVHIWMWLSVCSRNH